MAFTFGSAAGLQSGQNVPTTTSGFSFGSGITAPMGPVFGGATKTTTTAPGGFGFGSGLSFGAATVTTASGTSLFGASTGSKLAFGSSDATKTTSSAQPSILSSFGSPQQQLTSVPKPTTNLFGSPTGSGAFSTAGFATTQPPQGSLFGTPPSAAGSQSIADTTTASPATTKAPIFGGGLTFGTPVGTTIGTSIVTSSGTSLFGTPAMTTTPQAIPTAMATSPIATDVTLSAMGEAVITTSTAPILSNLLSFSSASKPLFGSAASSIANQATTTVQTSGILPSTVSTAPSAIPQSFGFSFGPKPAATSTAVTTSNTTSIITSTTTSSSLGMTAKIPLPATSTLFGAAQMASANKLAPFGSTIGNTVSNATERLTFGKPMVSVATIGAPANANNNTILTAPSTATTAASTLTGPLLFGGPKQQPMTAVTTATGLTMGPPVQSVTPVKAPPTSVMATKITPPAAPKSIPSSGFSFGASSSAVPTTTITITTTTATNIASMTTVSTTPPLAASTITTAKTTTSIGPTSASSLFTGTSAALTTKKHTLGGTGASTIASGTAAGLGIMTTSALATSTTTGATSLLTAPVISSTVTSTDTSLKPAIDSGQALTFGQLNQLISRWTFDVDEQEKAFLNQATEINAWDRVIRENGIKIGGLCEDVNEAEFALERADHDLDFVAQQQRELETLVGQLESGLNVERWLGEPEPVRSPVRATTTNADLQREMIMNLQTSVDAQMKQSGRDVSEMVERVKTLIGQKEDSESETDDVTQQIALILDKQMDALTWVDRQTDALEQKLTEIKKEVANRTRTDDVSF